MIVLDTNVISALMRDVPEPLVVAWLDAQPAEVIWTTAISIFEIQFGLSILPHGRKRQALQDAFGQSLKQDLEGRVLAFVVAAAQESAAIAARLRSAGRPVEVRDVMIAGTVAARQAMLATGNTKHFDDCGLLIINPWEDGAYSG